MFASREIVHIYINHDIGYGMSELTNITVCDVDEKAIVNGSVGKLLPRVQGRV